MLTKKDILMVMAILTSVIINMVIKKNSSKKEIILTIRPRAECCLILVTPMKKLLINF